MNQKTTHNTSDEIIDFDDEYCENYNDQEQITPEEPRQKDNQISKEDQVQLSQMRKKKSKIIKIQKKRI